MDKNQLSYLIFIIALIVSFLLDLFVFSKKDKEVSIKSATYQYLFWVTISLAYCGFLWAEFSSKTALEFLSAYFMEMSLSIDNIFVFVMIFASLQINVKNVGRVLMIGVVLAILFRIIFIAIGIVLVQKFHFILYFFGAFLIFTGVKMFFQNQEEENDVRDGKLYKFIRRYLRYTDAEPHGKYIINKNGKSFFTKLALAILIIGVTDIVFALDSIPAVFAITTDNLIVFSSNIFAVLGLRALFFILQKAADKFDFLQQGIAIVLILVGAKMFLELINIHIPVWASLLSIVVCIGGSIVYSLYHNRIHTKLDHHDEGH
ncbi:MAG: TerC/Alx family metal homeostasis membrane protein [Bacteroidetes bacterium]|jgi:tellurite resistance protein TerC|nr:TerC/Alx family metal homeostasis membrane protein [Bacteroidota bacterium]HMT34491.1 TerC/Alx family metal homeostasis membrane protein [Chitinophagaceae bacterium]MBK6820334.1 TerC/Alx family metal homeostasis membrane protein [Bacteroidota bacterium]MBK8328770.1 TerC/Alx family metal homeostasis membrane protein [Bacteroidota bacterium]MBK9481653.1 TerC/Alx family metal homeostasis membrane protein [Bacteroidota bacterium]